MGILSETIAGFKVSTTHVLVAALVGFVFLGMFFVWAKKRRVFAATAIRDTALGVSTVVLGLVALDVGYSVFLNSSQPRLAADDRRFDPNTWVGELYPELYFPTEKNFRLHKPGRSLSGSHYGDMYSPAMLDSPLLSSSVLCKKNLTISINDDGFRETARLEGHKIIALGDSFTFGWGVDQDRTWVELLERTIGEPVYNMGIHDSSPKQELLLLEHVIDSRKLDLRGGLLLWMIFEGNDLEDSYDELYPVQNPVSTSGSLFKGTIVEPLWALPFKIREESVFAKFRDGRAELSAFGSEERTKNHYVIDGITLADPLYVSPRFGPKLFSSKQLRSAQQSEQYVESHPNRLPLQKTFEGMASLAQRAGFQVVVIIAPSDARLYGAEFEEFPRLSDKSYFNILITRLAGQHGFEIVNLQESLRPYATRELLHFRDDDHWNEQGHAAFADILSGFLRSRNATIKK
ncbi:MAG: hypothetical protein P0120_01535 [Nitrospira sp.]|nr:hypothetical protein [Nitrospira sp.]